MGVVGWRNAFAIFGCLGVVWAVAFYFWYRDDPRQNPKVNQAERDLIARTAPPAAGHGNVPWRRLLRSQQVWMLCWQYFCLSYGWYFYLTWLPTYLREGRHLDITHAALLNVLPLFVGGMGNPAAVLITGPMTRWTGSVAAARRLIAYVGFAGAAGFLLISTRAGDPTLAMIAMGDRQLLERPGHARRLGQRHGFGRQVLRNGFRRYEYVGQYRRSPGAAGERLHPGRRAGDQVSSI